MNLAQIVIIIVLISLNAFFVAVEFAVIASRRARLDLLSGPDDHSAALVRTWLEDETSRGRLIAASQLGITIASLTLGAIGVSLFQNALQPYLALIRLPASLAFLQGGLRLLPLILSLLVVITIHVVLGEQVPKAAVLGRPERFAMLSAPFMQVFIAIFRGFIFVLDWLTRSILSLFGLPSSGQVQSTMVPLEELRQMVSGPESADSIDAPEREMISAVIDFSALFARQVSIPRTEIIAVETGTPVVEAVRIASEHGVTKLPVYEGSLDQIMGILHLKDLLPALLEDGNLNSRPSRELTREALFVPESISVNDLLVHMRARRQHMAITLDEFGGTAGLVTLEDLLEEIVGDVRDPFDRSQPEIVILPDGTALVDGLAQIEEVNDAFDLNLYDPDYDTIAGYVLGKLGRIAQVGDLVEDGDNKVRLRVDTMDRLRIARIHLSRMLPTP
jgi:CBS domain containing-hemolysin-like protein